MYSIDLDFVTDDATTETEVLSEVNAWIADNGLLVTPAVKQLVGPGGGWPEITFSAEALDDLERAYAVYSPAESGFNELVRSV